MFFFVFRSVFTNFAAKYKPNNKKSDESKDPKHDRGCSVLRRDDGLQPAGAEQQE